MMIFSLVAMIGLEKCYITSACLQWLCHSGERTVARGPLVLSFESIGCSAQEKKFQLFFKMVVKMAAIVAILDF